MTIEQEHELNRFWNAVVAGDTARDGFRLAQTDMDLVQQLHAMTRHADVGPSATQTWRSVLARIEAREAAKDEAMTVLLMPETLSTILLPNSRARSLSLPRVPVPKAGTVSRWALGQIATAALLVLTLAAGLFAIGPQRLRLVDRPTSLPLIAGTPTVAAEVTTETLLQGTAPALPSGPAEIWATAYVMQPGAETNPSTSVAREFFTIEQGTVHIALSGAERTLQAGETWSESTQAGFVLRNIEADEARVINVEVIDSVASRAGSTSSNGNFSDPLSGTWDILIQDAATLPGGPGEVTLERLTLPSGTAMPPYTDKGLYWMRISAGRLGVTLEGERLPFRWKSGTERTFGVAQHVPVIPPGTRVTLRNADDVPLILYRLTIAPSGAGGALAATPAGDT